MHGGIRREFALSFDRRPRARDQFRKAYTLERLTYARADVGEDEVAATNSELRVESNQHGEPRLVHSATVSHRHDHLLDTREFCERQPLGQGQCAQSSKVIL